MNTGSYSFNVVFNYLLSFRSNFINVFWSLFCTNLAPKHKAKCNYVEKSCRKDFRTKKFVQEMLMKLTPLQLKSLYSIPCQNLYNQVGERFKKHVNL